MFLRFIIWGGLALLWLVVAVVSANIYDSRQKDIADTNAYIDQLKIDMCISERHGDAWWKTDKEWWKWYYGGMRGEMPVPPTRESFADACRTLIKGV